MPAAVKLTRFRDSSCFCTRHAITYLLLPPNLAGYVLCLRRELFLKFDLATLQRIKIHGTTLFHYGALYPDALDRGEYWRLPAYVFLHANVLHLLMTMICLVRWGRILENRIGAFYFSILYFASVVGGGLATIYGHGTAFLTAGASGAVLGVAGALLYLKTRRKLPFSLQVFAANSVISFLLIASATRADWIADLGGFITGVAICAAFDGIEIVNRHWLRCKLPEFVKFSVVIVCGYLFAFTGLNKLAGAAGEVFTMATLVLVALLMVKGADLLLAQVKGLAITVIAFAAVMSWLPLFLASPIEQTLSPVCEKVPFAAFIEAADAASAVESFACRNEMFAPVISGAFLFIITLLILKAQLSRGIKDPGFVPQAFQAERSRGNGI
jgi:membrane associated rhomboid family serine protease